MPKVRTTLTIDETILRAVKVRAARTGKGDSEVIEEALRRDLGLDLLERSWARNSLSDSEAQGLAVEAQHDVRDRDIDRHRNAGRALPAVGGELAHRELGHESARLVEQHVRVRAAAIHRHALRDLDEHGGGGPV